MKPESIAASLILAIAAYIDWKEHRVPNWLTFSAWGFGLTFHTFLYGSQGFMESGIGSLVGLATLIVPYALRGMGAGDVKLMAAVGAWVGAAVTLHAFLWIVIVGGVMGLYSIFRTSEIVERLRRVVRAGCNLFALRRLDAGEPKQSPSRLLLPYGVPIAIGFFAYFIFGEMI